jgi:hypothetical protein
VQAEIEIEQAGRMMVLEQLDRACRVVEHRVVEQCDVSRRRFGPWQEVQA